MSRCRVYNDKGAKFTTTSEKAKGNSWLLVEGVELLHRKALWERKIDMCSDMATSQEYYLGKLQTCLDKLHALRSEGFYIPTKLAEIRPTNLRDAVI